jgi:hypothetical protein
MDRCVLVDRKVLRGKHGLPSGSYAWCNAFQAFVGRGQAHPSVTCWCGLKRPSLGYSRDPWPLWHVVIPPSLWKNFIPKLNLPFSHVRSTRGWAFKKTPSSHQTEDAVRWFLVTWQRLDSLYIPPSFLNGILHLGHWYRCPLLHSRVCSKMKWYQHIKW